MESLNLPAPCSVPLPVKAQPGTCVDSPPPSREGAALSLHGTGARCAICGEAIEGVRIHCLRCLVPHHVDCWKWNHGRCGIYGCAGRSALPLEKMRVEVFSAAACLRAFGWSMLLLGLAFIGS